MGFSSKLDTFSSYSKNNTFHNCFRLISAVVEEMMLSLFCFFNVLRCLEFGMGT